MAELRRGHVIPQFVTRYIKSTSAKVAEHPRLRQGIDGRLVQSGPAHHMFCEQCEQLLSRDERLFSEEMFGESFALSSEPLHYGEWLLRFTCGLMLKVLIENLYFLPNGDATSREVHLMEGACEDLRDYLLGQSDWPGKLKPLRISVGFTRIPDSPLITSLWDYYMVRGFDTNIVTGEGLVAVYAHVPFHVFWMGVSPKKVRASDWTNCRIKKSGLIDPNISQYASDPFWSYVHWRLESMAPVFEEASRATRQFLNRRAGPTGE